jgi:hypothetical protein
MGVWASLSLSLPSAEELQSLSFPRLPPHSHVPDTSVLFAIGSLHGGCPPIARLPFWPIVIILRLPPLPIIIPRAHGRRLAIVICFIIVPDELKLVLPIPGRAILEHGRLRLDRFSGVFRDRLGAVAQEKDKEIVSTGAQIQLPDENLIPYLSRATAGALTRFAGGSSTVSHSSDTDFSGTSGKLMVLMARRLHTNGDPYRQNNRPATDT